MATIKDAKRVERLVGDKWFVCRRSRLKPGDIYRIQNQVACKVYIEQSDKHKFHDNKASCR